MLEEADEGLREAQRRYLEGEILTLTIGGAHGRPNPPIYLSGAEGDHNRVKLEISSLLKSLSRQYEAGLASESQHIENIQFVASTLTRKFEAILYGAHYRIGVAQKLLNLYLKYCWVLGWIKEPPHCPLDNEIISELRLGKPVGWTAIDSIEEYRGLVEAVRSMASRSGVSLARWELEVWSRRRAKTANRR